MATDKNVVGLKDRLSEVRQSILTLRCMISASTSKDIKIICTIMDELDEYNIFAPDDKTPNQKAAQRLDAVISALQKIYQTEIK